MKILYGHCSGNWTFVLRSRAQIISNVTCRRAIMIILRVRTRNTYYYCYYCVQYWYNATHMTAALDWYDLRQYVLAAGTTDAWCALDARIKPNRNGRNFFVEFDCRTRTAAAVKRFVVGSSSFNVYNTHKYILQYHNI